MPDGQALVGEAVDHPEARQRRLGLPSPSVHRVAGLSRRHRWHRGPDESDYRDKSTEAQRGGREYFAIRQELCDYVARVAIMAAIR
jgi:hypothetical protein